MPALRDDRRETSGLNHALDSKSFDAKKNGHVPDREQLRSGKR